MDLGANNYTVDFCKLPVWQYCQYRQPGYVYIRWIYLFVCIRFGRTDGWKFLRAVLGNSKNDSGNSHYDLCRRLVWRFHKAAMDEIPVVCLLRFFMPAHYLVCASRSANEIV